MNLMDKIYQMQNEMYRKYYVQPTKIFMNKATRDALKQEVAPFLVEDENIIEHRDMVLNMELRIDENLSDGMILLSE